MNIDDRPNILVVCGKNKRRSKTAEFIFKNDERFHIRSAGVSPNSERKINERILSWADLILVMEQEHKAKIKDLYRNLELPKIVVLEIEDQYEHLDPELISILKDKINDTLHELYNV